MFSIFVKYILPILLGLFGTIIALIGWHGYNDHKTFHELLNALARNAQAQQTKPSN